VFGNSTVKRQFEKRRQTPLIGDVGHQERQLPIVLIQPSVLCSFRIKPILRLPFLSDLRGAPLS
jgi:hypothetical protein